VSIVRLARPDIRGLKPYEAAVQVENTIRLNANEAPWTATGDRFRRPLNRYPEIRPQRLQRTLADRYGCAAKQLLVTRGSSEAIDLLVRAFCRAGVDNIVTTSPTFSMYRHYAEIQGAELREVKLSPDNDFAIDIDALLDACDKNTRIIFVCSPNNPTGTAVPADMLVELLERRGDDSAIVLDEAYVEFSDQGSAIDLVERFDNLIILRTLSKALAHAGARCGAVIGPGDVIAMINAIQAPYALATPVVECVEDALEAENLREAEQWVDAIVAERERLITAVGAFGIVRRIYPSAANFFLVEVDNVESLMRRSNGDKVLLRYFGGELADYVRISVGTRAENDHLLKIFAAAEGN